MNMSPSFLSELLVERLCEVVWTSCWKAAVSGSPVNPCWSKVGEIPIFSLFTPLPNIHILFYKLVYLHTLSAPVTLLWAFLQYHWLWRIDFDHVTLERSCVAVHVFYSPLPAFRIYSASSLSYSHLCFVLKPRPTSSSFIRCIAQHPIFLHSVSLCNKQNGCNLPGSHGYRRHQLTPLTS